jgi:hypothetical protein
VRLYVIEGLVEKVLKEYEDARSSDEVLIFRVYKEINEDAMIRELFCEIMLNRKEYGLPSFKSIERSRRKVFEKHPYLKPEKVTEFRKEKEQEYREYASNS